MEAIKALLLLPSLDSNNSTPPPTATNHIAGLRPLSGRLLHYDALRGAFLPLQLPTARDPECLVCAPAVSSSVTRIRTMEESGAWVAAAGLRGALRGFVHKCDGFAECVVWW